MTQKALIAGILGMALSVGMTGSAFAEKISKTLTITPNTVGMFAESELSVGDEVQLTLRNPSSKDLIFQTTQPLGTERRWVVPAGSVRVVSFIYKTPFSNRVSFVAMDADGRYVTHGPVFIDNDAVVAGENLFQRTLTLGPNMVGTMNLANVDIGDEVQLTLMNPTEGPLTFMTTSRLGAEKQWVIPGNSSRTVAFKYSRPFSDTIEYVVLDTDGAHVAHGVLFELATADDVDMAIDPDVELGDDVFRQTLVLTPGMKEASFDDLDVGDSLVITFVNPLNNPVQVQTTERLGVEKTWIVPANSERTVAYQHNQPFSQDVRYEVKEVDTDRLIIKGILIPVSID